MKISWKSKYKTWFEQELSMDAEIVMWKIFGEQCVSNADKILSHQIHMDFKKEDIVLKLTDQAVTTLTKRLWLALPMMGKLTLYTFHCTCVTCVVFLPKCLIQKYNISRYNLEFMEKIKMTKTYMRNHTNPECGTVYKTIILDFQKVNVWISGGRF